MKPKLFLDLIPSTSFWKSLRSKITKTKWDKVRKKVYQQSKYTCQICGTDEQNYQYNKKGWLHCDEIWDYKNDQQILIGLRAICRMCHLVKHMGFAQVVGLYEQAFEHLLKVNNWTEREGEEHVKFGFLEWATRSQKVWRIDYFYLEEFLAEEKI